ncbi:Uncharacterised protein [Bordetella ansorpii]|uniref:Uncharacterized protein n=1 Tax=Bordetella ansorpii TaxID=288768 RepID=A0A157SRK0_9BORD|nr:hypothetical protein [Bordetella ansorpii]SAI72931.1 Uncharacterised protein [Bordetella ansorpii]
MKKAATITMNRLIKDLVVCRFQKIREILNDVVSMKIIMKEDVPGGREIASVSLTREDSTHWKIESPALLPREDIDWESVDMPLVLETMRDHALKYWLEFESQESWDVWEETVSQYLEAGGAAFDFEDGKPGGLALTEHGYDAHKYAPLFSYAYYLQAKKLLSDNDVDGARCSVERGVGWLFRMIPNPKMRYSERAKNNGRKKHQKADALKAKVIDLLKDTSTNDLHDKKAGIERIVLRLKSDHQDLIEASGLDEWNLERVVADWIRRDPVKFQLGTQDSPSVVKGSKKHPRT